MEQEILSVCLYSVHINALLTCFFNMSEESVEKKGYRDKNIELPKVAWSRLLRARCHISLGF